VGLSPPVGSGAVQLAWGATGEMADSAAIVFGWKFWGAAVVFGKSVGPGVGIRMGERMEAGCGPAFFILAGCLGWV